MDLPIYQPNLKSNHLTRDQPAKRQGISLPKPAGLIREGSIHCYYITGTSMKRYRQAEVIEAPERTEGMQTGRKRMEIGAIFLV